MSKKGDFTKSGQAEEAKLRGSTLREEERSSSDDSNREDDSNDEVEEEEILEEGDGNHYSYTPEERPIRTDNVSRVRLRNGYVDRVNDRSARVVVEHKATTAIQCPCEMQGCDALLNIGRWARLGGGSNTCSHCKHVGGEYGFPKLGVLKAHLGSRAYRATRGITTQNRVPRQVLGEYLVDEANDRSHKRYKNDDGNRVKVFSCPKCKEEVQYKDRFSHFALSGMLGKAWRDGPAVVDGCCS